MPSAAVYGNNSLRRHVKIIGKQRDEFGPFTLLDVHISDDSGHMVDVALAEHHRLLTVSHQSLRHLKHTVHKYIIFEILPHLGDINHTATRVGGVLTDLANFVGEAVFAAGMTAKTNTAGVSLLIKYYDADV